MAAMEESASSLGGFDVGMDDRRSNIHAQLATALSRDPNSMDEDDDDDVPSGQETSSGSSNSLS